MRAQAVRASGGVATFDVPRNVVAAWTTTAVLTVTGTEYGKVVVESAASGTSMTGKKAFKTVTGVAASTAVTLAAGARATCSALPAFLPANKAASTWWGLGST